MAFDFLFVITVFLLTLRKSYREFSVVRGFPQNKYSLKIFLLFNSMKSWLC